MREQVLARELLHARPQPDRWQRVRVPRVEIREQRVERELEGRVRACLDLAEDQAPLGLDRVRGQARLQRDFRDEREHRLPVARERGAADLRVLHLRRRVYAAAELFGRNGEVHVRAARRAACHHTLQEVRDPGVLARLDARARAHEQRHGHDPGRRVLSNEHAQAVRQRGAGDTRLVGGDGGRAEKDERQREHPRRRLHCRGTNVTRT